MSQTDLFGKKASILHCQKKIFKFTVRKKLGGRLV